MVAVERLDPANSGKPHPTIVLEHHFSECAIINELRLIHIDLYIYTRAGLYEGI